VGPIIDISWKADGRYEPNERRRGTRNPINYFPLAY
jgi:hypothetical protein